MRKRRYNGNQKGRPARTRFVSDVRVVKSKPEGEETPTAVSIIMKVRGLGNSPVVMQLDDPVKVDLLITELQQHCAEVWPEEDKGDKEAVDG